MRTPSELPMGPVPFTDGQKRAALRLRARGKTWPEVAAALNICCESEYEAAVSAWCLCADFETPYFGAAYWTCDECGAPVQDFGPFGDEEPESCHLECCPRVAGHAATAIRR